MTYVSATALLIAQGHLKMNHACYYYLYLGIKIICANKGIQMVNDIMKT